MTPAIKQDAAHVFQTHPDEKIVYATSDGNVFLEREQNSARVHAQSKGLEAPITITRNAALAEDAPAPDAPAPESDTPDTDAPAPDASEADAPAPDAEAEADAEVPIEVVVPKL